MKKEIWKDIPDYKGYYQVSNLGNVKSLGRFVNCKNGVRFKKESILVKNLNTSNGYYHVILSVNSIKKIYLIHQLIGVTFLKYEINGRTLVIDHIDGNKLNNKLDNLRIISNRENISKGCKNKTSNYIGVSKRTNSKKWASNIYFNGKLHNLGTFKTEYEAHLAYQKKIKEITNA